MNGASTIALVRVVADKYREMMKAKVIGGAQREDRQIHGDRYQGTKRGARTAIASSLPRSALESGDRRLSVAEGRRREAQENAERPTSNVQRPTKERKEEAAPPSIAAATYRATGEEGFVMKALRYFFCVVFPPLAVLMTGRIASFFLSIILTLLGWIPGVIHACLVVNDYHAEQRAAAH